MPVFSHHHAYVPKVLGPTVHQSNALILFALEAVNMGPWVHRHEVRWPHEIRKIC